jgi:hypothetical protein
MLAVGDAFRAAGVKAVYLAHGTFVGTDTLGIVTELARVFPSATEGMRRLIRRLINRLTGDVGNYTEGYARLFGAAINRPGAPRIPVRLFQWSSENHHLGRADGAVRLLDELASLQLGDGQRVLLWGHSHAGNVFALVTNLLGGGREAIDEFFSAAEIYYRWPIVGCVDIPVWERVRALLEDGLLAAAHVPLDIATFGTPVRYGWDSAGYGQLLHFIHRRPAEGQPEYRAAFPPRFHDVLSATEGDYVQQLGIAGTNVMPSIFAWRAWLADSRLGRLLQPNPSEAGLLQRLQAGTIVPEEGATLLVDYGRPHESITKHHAGHAVYTQKKWLLFHAEEVARQFYHCTVSSRQTVQMANSLSIGKPGGGNLD